MSHDRRIKIISDPSNHFMASSNKRISFTMMYTAFMLAASVTCSSATYKTNTISPYSSAQSTVLGNNYLHESDAQNIIPYVMTKLEGSGFVANDNGRGPSRYGIVGRDNGLSYKEVFDLSPSRAVSIYKGTYWDAIHADSLPANMRLVAFNASIQFGIDRARKMLAEDSHDPDAFLRAGSDFYHALVQENPEKYAHSLKGWEKRQKILEASLGMPIPKMDLTTYVPLKESFRTATVPLSSKTIGAPSRIQIGIAEITPLHRPSPLIFKTYPKTTLYAANTSNAPYNPIHHQFLWVGLGLVLADVPGEYSAFLLARWWRRMLKRRRQISKEENDTPIFTLAPTDTSEQITPERAENPASEQKKAPESVSSQKMFVGFSDDERSAFIKVFRNHNVSFQENGTQCRVDYVDSSFILIKPKLVEVHGERGIEDSLRYAAKAWGNTCKITKGSPENISKISEVAQKLVDEGALAPGFTIEGVATFQRRPRPAPESKEGMTLIV